MKWTALSKKQPSFDQKTIFTDSEKDFEFWIGTMADITETKTGKIFMSYDDGNEMERRTATHWMIPDEPS